MNCNNDNVRLNTNSNIFNPTLFALIISVCCFLACFCSGNLFYYTNDDTSIQNTLSGCAIGEPFAIHPFINALLGYIISSLYKIEPRVQWWYIYSQTLMIGSVFLINYCFFTFIKERNISILFAVVFLPILDIVFFIYPISSISFTIVPGVCGTAIIAMLLTKDNGKLRWHEWALLYVMFIVLVCHRAQSGELVLCYILLGLFYYYFSKGAFLSNIKPFLLIAAILVLTTFSLVKGNGVYQEMINGSEFNEYNSARSAYMDYPHDSFDENPEIFKKVGWDENIYKLVGMWCFLDDHVTTDNFRYLVEHSHKKAETINIHSILNRWMNIQKDSLIISIEIVWILVFLTTLAEILLNYKRFNALTFLFNVLGTAILILYQVCTGRVLYRTLIITFMPSVLINIMITLKCIISAKEKGDVRLPYIILASLLLCSLPSIYLTLSYTFNNERISNLSDAAEIDEMVSDYALNHSEDLYIMKIGITLNNSPRAIYPDRKPTNVVGWGGAEFNSKGSRLLLLRNGITRLSGKTFEEDGVHLIFPEDMLADNGEMPKDSCLPVVYLWLSEHYGAKGIVQEEEICAGIFVYHFVFTNNDVIQDEVYEYKEGRFVRAIS